MVSLISNRRSAWHERRRNACERRRPGERRASIRWEPGNDDRRRGNDRRVSNPAWTMCRIV